MLEAQHSRLPAMHIAAALNKTELVYGYVQSVIGFVGRLPEKEIAGFLELSCKGITLFHHAMIKGTADVIAACMSVILGSELGRKTKISLIEARRQPDQLGAFYLAMSCGLKENALQFVRGVLLSDQIKEEMKVRLLQCAKPASARKTGLNTPGSRALELAARTARAEAERMTHNRLVSDFDSSVERSTLGLATRQVLQTT